MPGQFYDTNIMLYAARPILHRADRRKREIAVELLARGDFMLSAQVLAEFYHNAVKPGVQCLASEEAESWIERMTALPCAPVDRALVKS